MRVEPASFAATSREAAALLTAAWEPPALHYTPEYLQWQADFPAVAGVGSLAAEARDGHRLVGFAGATPRRMRVSGLALPILVVSFVAVDPAYRGRGIAAELYSVLIDGIRRSAVRGILTFAQLDSKGLSVLEAAYRGAGFTGIDLGTYPTFARATGARGPATRPVRAADSRRPPVPLEVAGLLTEVPSPDAWEHQLRDPRPHVAMSTEDGSATAIVALAERRGRSAIEPFGLLTALAVSATGGEALVDLGAAGAEWLGLRARALIASNLTPYPAAAARHAEFRTLTGPTYAGRLYPMHPEDPALRAATRTSISVT